MQYNQPHGPIRNLEKCKNLACDLHREPRHDAVGDCNLVNVASLQLTKESLGIHALFLRRFRRLAQIITDEQRLLSDTRFRRKIDDARLMDAVSARIELQTAR